MDANEGNSTRGMAVGMRPVDRDLSTAERIRAFERTSRFPSDNE